MKDSHLLKDVYSCVAILRLSLIGSHRFSHQRIAKTLSEIIDSVAFRCQMLMSHTHNCCRPHPQSVISSKTDAIALVNYCAIASLHKARDHQRRWWSQRSSTIAMISDYLLIRSFWAKHRNGIMLAVWGMSSLDSEKRNLQYFLLPKVRPEWICQSSSAVPLVCTIPRNLTNYGLDDLEVVTPPP